MKERLIIIGSGLAGLAAALAAAEQGQSSVLVSEMPPERSQSVLAEGGINGELSGKTEDVLSHWADTVQAGAGLSDPNAVRGMVEAAPGIVRWLDELGTAFQRTPEGLALRRLGGHRKERTLFAGSSTGKAVITALADEARKQETAGLIKRLDHHRFQNLILQKTICMGCMVQDCYTEKQICLYGPVLLASGGMSGLFPGHATGTLKNDGSAAAAVFSQGVEFGNLEFIQYHPTTIPASGKNLLISEAARSEGGRLYIEKNGVPWYFLEELCGPEGNLASRDLTVKKMYEVCSRPDCRPPVYLDMREIPEAVWQKQLEGVKEECGKFLNINPEKTPVPVEPAVHYFMGGILVDEMHRANKNFLYAAGECACQYHGANRLGGNSMLGALYGGKVAARTAVEELGKYRAAACGFQEKRNTPRKVLNRRVKTGLTEEGWRRFCSAVWGLSEKKRSFRKRSVSLKKCGRGSIWLRKKETESCWLPQW